MSLAGDSLVAYNSVALCMLIRQVSCSIESSTNIRIFQNTSIDYTIIYLEIGNHRKLGNKVLECVILAFAARQSVVAQDEED